MNSSNGKTAGSSGDSQSRPSRMVTQLAVELVIGLGLAALLVIVAWASSNAIRFVYGGY